MQLHVGLVDGLEERQAHNVIVMTMRQQEVGDPGTAFDKVSTQLTNAGACINDNDVIVDIDLYARGGTAKPEMIGAGDRNGTSTAPDLDFKTHPHPLVLNWQLIYASSW